MKRIFIDCATNLGQGFESLLSASLTWSFK